MNYKNLRNLFVLLLFLLPLVSCFNGMNKGDNKEQFIQSQSILSKNENSNNKPELEPVMCEGNYTITNEDELNEIRFCNVITGNLYIKDTSLTNLDGLSNITSVGGSLEIYNNAALTNLDGLSNITSVGGDGWQIHNNDSLTNLDSLSNITSVWVDLEILNNDFLTNLDGLSNEDIIGKYITKAFYGDYYEENIYYSGEFHKQFYKGAVFLNLPTITPINNKFYDEINLKGFVEEGWAKYPEYRKKVNHYVKWKGTVKRTQSMKHYENPLVSINAKLKNITFIDDNLDPSKRQVIETYTVTLEAVVAIESLHKNWSRKKSYTKTITIRNLKNVTLKNLKNITLNLGWGSLSISENDALTNLDGLSNLKSVGGDLDINRNDTLINLNGLSNITSLRENLYIYYNPALTSLEGLSNLISVRGNLVISSNNVLTSLEGLSNLISVGGDLNLSNNNIKDISFLGNLTSLKKLDISYNSISNLNVLSQLNNLENLNALGNPTHCQYLTAQDWQIMSKIAFIELGAEDGDNTRVFANGKHQCRMSVKLLDLDNNIVPISETLLKSLVFYNEISNDFLTKDGEILYKSKGYDRYPYHNLNMKRSYSANRNVDSNQISNVYFSTLNIGIFQIRVELPIKIDDGFGSMISVGSNPVTITSEKFVPNVSVEPLTRSDGRINGVSVKFLGSDNSPLKILKFNGKYEGFNVSGIKIESTKFEKEIIYECFYIKSNNPVYIDNTKLTVKEAIDSYGNVYEFIRIIKRK